MQLPILGGEVFSYSLDGWEISWESDTVYRYWCYQQHTSNYYPVAVVMLNPGSLSGRGENLTKDTTLRVLREVFVNTGFNPLIINLFNLAPPNPEILFESWNLKDSDKFSYSSIPINTCKAVLFAYGNYEHHLQYGNEIKARISLVKRHFMAVQEIVIPTNKSGTPKHPIVWQRQMLKPVVHKAITDVFGRTIH